MAPHVVTYANNGATLKGWEIAVIVLLVVFGPLVIWGAVHGTIWVVKTAVEAVRGAWARRSQGPKDEEWTGEEPEGIELEDFGRGVEV